MKRTFLPAALAVALLGSVAFAQQPQQPAPDNGTANAPGYHHRGHHHPNPQQEAQFLSKKLNLNSDQTAKLEPVFADRDQKMQALLTNQSLTPDQRHEQMKSIHQGTEQQLSTILTPEQLQQMKQMRHEHHGGKWQGQGQPPAAPSAS
jgi:periplasmic protein CpxP/Spy